MIYDMLLLGTRTEGSVMPLTQNPNTSAAIWTRLLRPEQGDMSPDTARFFLNLAFDQQDLDRMHALAVKNQAGELSAEEQEELKNYRQVGLELDLLRAKAQRAIKHPRTVIEPP
jgi:uncharacterized protein YnzC (UPF0291/DUF896 family)